MKLKNFNNSNLEYEISNIYDDVLDNLVSDYEHLTDEWGLSHLKDYNADTDDYIIGYDLGYMNAIEVISKLLENYKIQEG